MQNNPRHNKTPIVFTSTPGGTTHTTFWDDKLCIHRVQCDLCEAEPIKLSATGAAHRFLEHRGKHARDALKREKRKALNKGSQAAAGTAGDYSASSRTAIDDMVRI